MPISRVFLRVSDGIRTRDRRDHNPELYQLSYAHQAGPNLACPAYSDWTVEERNVQIARQAIDAYNRRDQEAVLAFLADDVEVFSSPELPNGGTFRGRAGYREWIGQWVEAWDEHRVEVIDVESVGDRHMLVAVRQFGRGALSGVEIEMDSAMLFEIDADGKIVRFQLHLSREAALDHVPSG